MYITRIPDSDYIFNIAELKFEKSFYGLLFFIYAMKGLLSGNSLPGRLGSIFNVSVNL